MRTFFAENGRAIGRQRGRLLIIAVLSVLAAPVEAQNGARRRDADLIDLVGVPRLPETAGSIRSDNIPDRSDRAADAEADLAARVLRAAGMSPPGVAITARSVPLANAMGTPAPSGRAAGKIRNVVENPLPEAANPAFARPAEPTAKVPVVDPAITSSVVNSSPLKLAPTAPPPSTRAPLSEMPHPGAPAPSSPRATAPLELATPPEMLALAALPPAYVPPEIPSRIAAEITQNAALPRNSPAVSPRNTAAATQTPPREVQIPAPKQRPLPVAPIAAGPPHGSATERAPHAFTTATPRTEDDEIVTGATLQSDRNVRSSAPAPSEWDLPRAPRSRARPVLDQVAAQEVAVQSSTKIAYFVRSQPLDGVLREVGQLAGLRVVVGPGVRAVVRDRRLEGPAMQVIERLARDFSLFWFIDGGAVHVDTADDQKSRTVKVRGANLEQIEQSLAAAGLARHRDRIQILGSDGTVRVSGPESFLRAAENALNGSDADRSVGVKVVKFGQRTQ